METAVRFLKFIWLFRAVSRFDNFCCRALTVVFVHLIAEKIQQEQSADAAIARTITVAATGSHNVGRDANAFFADDFQAFRLMPRRLRRVR